MGRAVAPPTLAALRADERIVSYIKGLNAIDERLAALLAPPAPIRALTLAASQQAVVDAIVAHLGAPTRDTTISQVELLGTDPESKLDIATQVCAALKLRLYRLPLDVLASHKAELENLARLWQRETLLLPAALHVDADDIDAASPDASSALNSLLARDLGLVFVARREPAAQPENGSSR